MRINKNTVIKTRNGKRSVLQIKTGQKKQIASLIVQGCQAKNTCELLYHFGDCRICHKLAEFVLS